jgi:hypothetical protein
MPTAPLGDWMPPCADFPPLRLSANISTSARSTRCATCTRKFGAKWRARTWSTTSSSAPAASAKIEFIAQVFQLIRGGRDPALQIRPTFPCSNCWSSAN